MPVNIKHGQTTSYISQLINHFSAYSVFRTLWIFCVLCVRKTFVGSSMRFSVMVVTSGSIERVILVSFYMSF